MCCSTKEGLCKSLAGGGFISKAFPFPFVHYTCRRSFLSDCLALHTVNVDTWPASGRRPCRGRSLDVALGRTVSSAVCVSLHLSHVFLPGLPVFPSGCLKARCCSMGGLEGDPRTASSSVLCLSRPLFSPHFISFFPRAVLTLYTRNTATHQPSSPPFPLPVM